MVTIREFGPPELELGILHYGLTMINHLFRMTEKRTTFADGQGFRRSVYDFTWWLNHSHVQNLKFRVNNCKDGNKKYWGSTEVQTMGIASLFAGHGFRGKILIIDDIEYFMWVYKELLGR